MIVFDLDGTLANIDHRRHWVAGVARRNRGNWQKFYQACGQDHPVLPIVSLFRTLYDAFLPLQIWSGREESVRELTEEWLTHFVFDDGSWAQMDYRVPNRFVRLRMRPTGNTEPDDELKEKWLKSIDPGTITMAFDDRDKVVAMWRRNGIVCAQVAPGNF